MISTTTATPGPTASRTPLVLAVPGEAVHTDIADRCFHRVGLRRRSLTFTAASVAATGRTLPHVTARFLSSRTALCSLRHIAALTASQTGLYIGQNFFGHGRRRQGQFRPGGGGMAAAAVQGGNLVHIKIPH